MTDSYIRLLPSSDRLQGISALLYDQKRLYLRLQMKSTAGERQTVQYSTADLVHWREDNVAPMVQRCDECPEIFLGDVQNAVCCTYEDGSLVCLACVKGYNNETIVSLPFEKHKDELSLRPPVRLKDLRVWKRRWKYIPLRNSFQQALSFAILPSTWPDIRIVEPFQGKNCISSNQFEIELMVEGGQEKCISFELFGLLFQWDREQDLLIHEHWSSLIDSESGLLKLHMWIDPYGYELLCGDKVFCGASLPDFKQSICIEAKGGSATIVCMNVYGLRASHFSPKIANEIANHAWSKKCLYRCSAFSIFPDRVEDYKLGEPAAYVLRKNMIISPVRVVEEFEWRDTPWGDMTRVLHKGDCWEAGRMPTGFPEIKTKYAVVEAAWNVAAHTMATALDPAYALDGQKNMWSAGAFQGKGEGFGVWRRDAAQIILRCGTFFSKAITKTTLQYVLKTGINNGVDGMFLPVIALWDYIQATGDWQILDETWADAEYSINSVNGFFDDDLHLLQVERSTSNDAFPEKETGGYALSIQVYYSAALRAAANLARIRNQWEKAAAWDTRAQAVVKAVKKLYWNEAAGYYTSGPKGSTAFEMAAWETSGIESLLWDRLCTIDDEQKASILCRMQDVAWTENGIRLFPYRRDRNHFTHASWGVYSTGFAQAMAQQGALDDLWKLICQQIRMAVMYCTFYEVMDTDTGRCWRWPEQTWHAAGFISIFLYGVLGLHYNETHIWFEPHVPIELSSICLSGLSWRNAIFTIQIRGYGQKKHMLLDNRSVKQIPATLCGQHRLEILMDKIE